MNSPKPGYSPWENADDADEAVTAPLDAASTEQLEGFVGELLAISEGRDTAHERDSVEDVS